MDISGQATIAILPLSRGKGDREVYINVMLCCIMCACVLAMSYMPWAPKKMNKSSGW